MRRHSARGLVAKRRSAQVTDNRHPFPVAPDLPGRAFSAASKPNEARLADLACVAADEGWLRMAAIMDPHARKIIGRVAQGSGRVAGGTAAEGGACVTIPGPGWRATGPTPPATKAKRDLFSYVEGSYNHQRPHSALSHRTPNQAENMA